MDGNNSYKSPFSPASRQNISSRRTGVSSVFKKSSRFSVSGRSSQSVQVILKSQGNSVERFGQPLPVLITETLTFAERNTVVSARISENGFAWVVCGRRLLVWQYRQHVVQSGTLSRKQPITNQCYELQLPQSDLAHRAELVSVFLSSGSHQASCIAVSPEGVVRYWPAVAHEGISIEISVDLQGQECDSIISIDGIGCILATTTCTIVLVQPQYLTGRHSLLCRTLKSPSGWLGGIGKRMSSLIFGPISSEHSAETRLVRVLSLPLDNNSWTLYVLAGHTLQKWKLSLSEPEQLIFAVELNRLVRDGFYSRVWETSHGDLTEADTWLLDLQAEKDNVLILAAAVNLHLSPQIHYAIINLQTNTKTGPSTFKEFNLIKLSSLYREDQPSEGLSYRFLLSNNTIYLYNAKSITVIRPQDDVDTLEFNSPQDFILGGSVCINNPVFFSRNHGLIVITSNELGVDFNLSMNVSGSLANASLSEIANGTLTMYSLGPEEIQSSFNNAKDQLKTAFLFNLRNQNSSCQEILQTFFSSDGNVIPGVDCLLDKTVIQVCEELLDDIPAGDPRWTDNDSVGIGSSYSMQILQQLEDKQRALNIYIKFLKENELWQRFGAVTVRDNVIYTSHMIGEFAEKIKAAILFKNLMPNDIINKAIQKTIKLNDNSLSHQDLFFRKITNIHSIFHVLVNNCMEAAHSDSDPIEVASMLNKTNEIILVVLKEVIQFRQQLADNFNVTANILNAEYLPWTSCAGPEGLYDALIQQQFLTYNYGVKVTNDKVLCNTLYDQLVYIIDIILDGKKCHLESIRGTDREEILIKQYQSDRQKLLNPLVADKEWERAALLAEKYLDFEILVSICEATNNQQRLDEYMDRFENEGFSEYVYSWYLQQNKQGKLLERCKTFSKQRKEQKLTNFLSGHPSLLWLENVFERKFDNAAETLQKLAQEEVDSVIRQKTILSLSKLAKLVGNETDNEEFIENINARLELIAFQEELPDYLLEHFGYNTIKPQVIPAKDLIHLYICPEYKDATELEFKKALDLLSFIDESDLRNELMLQIWKNAIFRDSWNVESIDSPLDILQNKMFFKLADLSLVLGADPQNLLPPLDMLTEDPDLFDLQTDKNFLYLLKTCYEHFQRISCI